MLLADSKRMGVVRTSSFYCIESQFGVPVILRVLRRESSVASMPRIAMESFPVVAFGGMQMGLKLPRPDGKKDGRFRHRDC